MNKFEAKTRVLVVDTEQEFRMIEAYSWMHSKSFGKYACLLSVKNLWTNVLENESSEIKNTPFYEAVKDAVENDYTLILVWLEK